MSGLKLIVFAVNMWLAAQGATYRVTADVIHSRRDGYTLLALKETTNAADYRGGVNPPINNMR